MSIPYASSTDTPGCIYRAENAGEKSLRFSPVGAFTLLVFGELNGAINVYGIKKELLTLENSDDLWVELAPSNEIISGNQAVIFDVPSNLICEAHFENNNEAVYLFWDYGSQMVISRTTFN